MRRAILIPLILLIAATVYVANFITFFVIQPIGALPEGIVLVMARTGKLQMFESPDAICDRTMGGVSLFCRMSAMKVAVEANEAGTVYFRLPYFQWAYDLSTGGKRWE